VAEEDEVTAEQTEQLALLVVDMQNGFCHPEGSFAVLSSYQLAEIAAITAGFEFSAAKGATADAA
jgi:nicotinamidase-related amidase